jgi:pantothenate kinase type III
MLLTLDISNTTIKAGVFHGEKILADWRFATERHKLADEYGMLLLSLFQASGVPASEITGVSISCVVPPLRSVFDQFARKYLRVEPIIVGPGIKTGIKLAVDNPREVGSDRVINALATHRLYGGPAIGIAFGTATVFDCVSSDGEYLGGAIQHGTHDAVGDGAGLRRPGRGFGQTLETRDGQIERRQSCRHRHGRPGRSHRPGNRRDRSHRSATHLEGPSADLRTQ